MKRVSDNRKLTRGLAGLVVVIMVLGFLMMVSTSNVLLIRSEKQGTVSADYSEKAHAAAEAGIFFYMAILSSTDTTFLTTTAECRQRYHFLASTTRNEVSVAGQQVATYTGTAPTVTYTTVATSTWMFASGTAIFSGKEAEFEPQDIASASIFIIKTYADEGKLASYVYVKSLGAFRLIENNTAVASYYAQLNARLEIIPGKKKVIIDRIRRMRVEYPASGTSPFHTSLVKPWK